jgi:4-azaleucine resistance transporter AzlC
MGAAKRTIPPALLRDVLAISAAMLAVGASFGAIAVTAGLPAWAVVTMSTLVFAGGAQFMAAGLIAAGSPMAAVFAGLLLNARHLPFGLALNGALGDRWWQRLIGSHLMTDEAVAFALATPEGNARRRTYWLVGIMIFISWNIGTLLGMVLGTGVGDPAVFGVDAAFPAGLLALLLPSLRDRDTRAAALVGALVAVLVTPLLPAGLPVLLALAGLVVLVLPRRGATLSGRTCGPSVPPGPGTDEDRTPAPTPVERTGGERTLRGQPC